MKSIPNVYALALATILASSTPLSAQRSLSATSKDSVRYGVKTENGESWAYIEDGFGFELIAAPFEILSDGFKNQGAELAGTGGAAPRLTGSGSLQEGTDFVLTLSQALPNADVTLVMGSSGAYMPFMGGDLVPSPDSMLDFKTDGRGDLKVTLQVPSGTPAGTQMYFQFWINDPGAVRGMSASNGLLGNDEFVGETVKDDDRIRLLGLTSDEVDQISDKLADALTDVLNGQPADRAAYLWRTGFSQFNGTGGELTVLSHLSQHMMFFVEKAEEFEPYATWTANGCTLSPDFNFKSCCDTHDMCYCMGGNEAARLKCDKALRDCIKAKGHPRLAKIYYRAVRAFGKRHFNYC